MASNGRMSLSTYAPEAPPEETVRRFIRSLGSGRVIEALDAFALDAVIRDANGKEHRGIRRIVEFVNHLRLRSLVIEDIRQDRDTVTAIVQSATGRKQERLRHTYAVSRGRLQSLGIERLRSPRP